MTEGNAALEAFLADAAGARTASILRLARLSGGAIQENRLIDVSFSDGPWAGQHSLVLRADAPSQVAASLSRAQEFQVMQTVKAAGVTVPEPLWLCEDASVIGKPFFIMRFVAGTALGHRLVREPGLLGDREALACRLGRELARIHSITPMSSKLSFLSPPNEAPALASILQYRRHLDQMGLPSPALEWGLRWCEVHPPVFRGLTLVHQDFRTGNYLVDETGLAAILDWEFSGWGDPDSDIGWFCAKCWRFGADDKEAGGIAAREVFYEGYESEAARVIDREAIAYWEVMAHIRWGVIALQQGERHLSGREASLDLAMTGRIRPAEVEYEILCQTKPERWQGLDL